MMLGQSSFGPFHHHHQQQNSSFLRGAPMHWLPPKQEPSAQYRDYPHQYHHHHYPVQPSPPRHHSTIVVVHQPIYYSTPHPMQLPQTSNPAPMPIPARYNSYFSTTPHSRPIQINAPPARFINGSYNLAERVMGLDFNPHYPSPQNMSPVAESMYAMDFMDYDEPPRASASTSSHYQLSTDSIEEALRRTDISNDNNKENTRATRSVSVSPRKASSNSSIRVLGEPGMRSYKRRNSFDNDFLVNEETDSEAGFSGDDDECMSNCGCVHTCMDSPLDLDENQVQDAPFTRLGFRSIGDIIGYAQVVRAERLEALAELRNAVDKFNDMRQRNQTLRSQLNTTH